MTYLGIDSEFVLNSLYQLLMLNSRWFLLLCLCLLLIRVVKGSAARRHLFLATAFFAAFLIPVSTQWVPAFEIIVEVEQSVSAMEAENQTAARVVSNNATVWSQYLPLFFLSAYLGVTLLLLLRILLGNLKIARLSQAAHHCNLNNWFITLHDCTKILNVKQNIDLRHSTKIRSPMTWGLGKPLILIPTDALHWPESLRRSALLHELAHIKRRDCLSKQLARFVCACYWINPLCWVALRRFCDEAETASDDMALNSGIRYSHYAQNLLQVALQASQKNNHWNAALAMAAPLTTGKRSQFTKRVMAILNPNGCRTPVNGICVSLSFLFVIGVLLPISSLRASVVQEIRYVIPDPRTVIPVRPYSEEKENEALSEDQQLQAYNNSVLDTLAYQQSLRQQLQSQPVPKQPPPVQYEEIPTRVVLEQAKNKFKQTLASIRNEQVEDDPIALPPANSAALPIGSDLTDTTETVDLAGLIQGYHSVEHLADANNLDSPLKSRIEPYAAQRLVTPQYPRRAENRGIEGELLVEFSIDNRGQVTDAKIISAQPSGVFDRAVLKALEQNRYTPQRVDGKAVAVGSSGKISVCYRVLN